MSYVTVHVAVLVIVARFLSFALVSLLFLLLFTTNLSRVLFTYVRACSCPRHSLLFTVSPLITYFDRARLLT